MKTKQEFIIGTLKPYFKDTDLCALGKDGLCKYLTEDNKKCAVGQHIRPEKYEPEMENKGAAMLFRNWEMKDILTKEALDQNLNVDEWLTMQGVHDSLSGGITAEYMRKDCLNRIEKCEEESKVDLTELKELLNEL